MSAEIAGASLLAKSLQGLIGALVGAILPSAWFWNWKNGKDKADEEHAKKIQALELKAEKFLTREDAKAIVEESIQPVQKNVTKIQSTCDETNILLQNFITQFKVFQAVEEYKEKQERKDE